MVFRGNGCLASARSAVEPALDAGHEHGLFTQSVRQVPPLSALIRRLFREGRQSENARAVKNTVKTNRIIWGWARCLRWGWPEASESPGPSKYALI